MTAPLPITAIIVTYHSNAVLPQCLAALPPLASVLIADNGGTSAQPGTAHLHMLRNVGFGRAINRALAQVRTPYVLILNPDAELAAEALPKLISRLEAHPANGLAAPLLLDAGGQPRLSWRNLEGHKPEATPVEAAEVSHIPAAAWLLRTQALRVIGGFDRRFFMFFEDDDVCLRLRKAGYRLWLEPAACCVHLQGKSSPASLRTQWIKQYHYARSDLLFTAKHHGAVVACKRRARLLGGNLLRLLGGCLSLRPQKALAALARLSAVYRT